MDCSSGMASMRLFSRKSAAPASMAARSTSPLITLDLALPVCVGQCGQEDMNPMLRCFHFSLTRSLSHFISRAYWLRVVY